MYLCADAGINSAWHNYMRYHTQSVYLLCSLVLLISAVSCNGDLFVDDKTPLETSFTIEGDGGSCVARFQPEGLLGVFINNGYGADVSYYGRDGNQIPQDSPVSEIARINYTTMRRIVDVYIDGDKMTVHSTENASTFPADFVVRLDYGYTTEFIEVEVLPGKPMEITSVSYIMNQLQVNDNAEVRHSTIHYNNGGSLPARIYVKPYQAAQGYCELTTDRDYGVWEYTEGHGELLTFINGSWTAWMPEWPIRLNSKMGYFPVGIDRQTSVPVDIPPHSSADVVCSVRYAAAKVPCHVLFRNPESGRETFILASCVVLEPADYEIEIVPQP